VKETKHANKKSKYCTIFKLNINIHACAQNVIVELYSIILF